MEHEEQAREMERDVDKLEEHSDEVGERIEETRREWEAKEQDPSIPGAQPEAVEPELETREESDQLPEEGPEEQVHDDAGGAVRNEAEENPGVPGETGTATGNPDAAGAEE
jgi:hypothetical protein